MTPTFRTFLEDIDLLDPLDYAPSDADETIERVQASLDEKVSWKKLPVTFPQKGFEVHYRRRPRDFDVALVDTRSGVGRSSKPRIAVNVNMERKHAELLTADGGQNVLYGMQTQVLSGADGYRGLGLAPLLYRTLVEHGQVLECHQARLRRVAPRDLPRDAFDLRVIPVSPRHAHQVGRGLKNRSDGLILLRSDDNFSTGPQPAHSRDGDRRRRPTDHGGQPVLG